MTSKTVKSPAGETIEIVDDDDWVVASGATSLASLRQWGMGRKPQVIRALWEHGKFTNKSGRATGDLLAYISSHYGETDGKPHSVSTLMGDTVNAPAFDRELNGKRTNSIQLVALPEMWHRKLLADIGPGKPSSNGDRVAADSPQVPQEATELPGGTDVTNGAAGFTDEDWQAVQLDAPTVFEVAPPMEIQMAHQVAMAMLTSVVEIISAGTADTSSLSGSQRLQAQLTESQHLLSQRLMENDKLRRQLREAGDMINALRTERDGLRSRLRMTEHNLTEVLKGETAQAVNAEITKRVDQIMRQAPGPKGD